MQTPTTNAIECTDIVFATENSSHDDRLTPKEVEEILNDGLELNDAIFEVERIVYSSRNNAA